MRPDAKPPNPTDVATYGAAMALAIVMSKASLITRRCRKDLLALFKGYAEKKQWGQVRMVGQQLRRMATVIVVLPPNRYRKDVRQAAESWDRCQSTEAFLESLQYNPDEDGKPKLQIVASNVLEPDLQKKPVKGVKLV
jgi:hypothetical protein